MFLSRLLLVIMVAKAAVSGGATTVVKDGKGLSAWTLFRFPSLITTRSSVYQAESGGCLFLPSGHRRTNRQRRQKAVAFHTTSWAGWSNEQTGMLYPAPNHQSITMTLPKISKRRHWVVQGDVGHGGPERRQEASKRCLGERVGD
ncbi:hypothetical protein HDK90DRAFT_152480 [Phyllosticta capitalensis]|uniref:Secreted protein n=1 Tax=Phyllosticta capitalensis TaxID=121624 RepID=A0ABR1Z045_9PEZI